MKWENLLFGAAVAVAVLVIVGWLLTGLPVTAEMI